MSNSNDILQELKNYDSILAGLSRKMPYFIDASYFNIFSNNIAEVISNEHIDDEIMGISKDMPYQLPELYFTTLTEVIITGIKNADLIASPAKPMPFEVNTTYFNDLPTRILTAAKNNDKAKTKIIPINPVHRTLRWAAAAVLLLSVSICSYHFLANRAMQDPDTVLANVSKNDINDYIDLHTDYFNPLANDNNNDVPKLDLQVSQFDNDDIVHYLNETGWEAID